MTCLLIAIGCGRLGFEVPSNLDAGVDSTDARVTADDASIADASLRDEDLLVWLRFDDPSVPGLDSQDTLGPGSCLGNGCPTLTTGLDGQALALDGIDDALVYESASELDFANRGQPFSISLWYRASDLGPAGKQVLMAQSRGQTQVSFQLAFENIQANPALDLVWKVCESDCLSGSFATEPDVLAAPVWRFIVGTWDGQMTRLYVNGIQVDSVAKNSISFDRSPLVVGADLEGIVLSNFFRGSIDDLRITERVLTVAEQIQMILDIGPGF